MRIAVINVPVFLLVLGQYCFSQDPLPVIKSGWQPVSQKVSKPVAPVTGPAKQMIVEDTVGLRTAREFSTVHPDDPSQQTPDGRRAVIEKNEQDARTPPTTDVKGFFYTATVRNEGAKNVTVIYWEYLFTDPSRPDSITRRQFLCSVNLKKGGELELAAFSTFGPSDTIDAAKLAAGTDNHLVEKVQINRIEYADDQVLQRGNWKFADVKTAVDRATATPWGKEMCRPL